MQHRHEPTARPHSQAARLLPLLLTAGLATTAWANPLLDPFLDDRAINADLVERGEAVVTAEGAVSNADLQEQLDRATCALNLPNVSMDLDGAADPTALVQRIEAATLIVSELYLCGNCDNYHANPASGFVISPDGLAVTNHHVIESDNDNGGGFVAETRDGHILPIVEVLAANERADVALVRLEVPEGVTLTALPLAEAAVVGEDVHCVSHPVGQFYTYTRGVVTRRFLEHKGRNHTTPRIAVTAEYAKGSSGAPMVNDAGEVIGLVTTTRSVYYTENNGEQRDLQLVLRHCVPVESIRALFAPVSGPASAP